MDKKKSLALPCGFWPVVTPEPVLGTGVSGGSMPVGASFAQPDDRAIMPAIASVAIQMAVVAFMLTPPPGAAPGR